MQQHWKQFVFVSFLYRAAQKRIEFCHLLTDKDVMGGRFGKRKYFFLIWKTF